MKVSPGIKYIIELALIRGIPDFYLDRNVKGRLKGIYKNLIKAVDSQLSYCNYITDQIKHNAEKILDSFADDVGWKENRHIMTHISFLLMMIEESEHSYSSNIIKYLNMLSDHFERVGKHPIQSDWSAELAMDIWRDI